MQAGLEEIHHSIEDTADLAKHRPNRPIPTPKDMQICMEIPYVGLRLIRLVSNFVAITKSLAWKKYAGVPAEARLRLEDPALPSLSCLHLVIVDLLSVILDRYRNGI